jgi:putative secretion ATPase (PEP-CTERM system associated)
MYEKYFGFTAKPFRLAPDPRFFYASRSHKRAMAYLLYGVKQGEGFIVITGDVGTGKTTLLNNLLRVVEKEEVSVAQVVTSQLEAEDLLQVVAAACGRPYENVSKGVLLKSLEAYLTACYREGRRALLVVDEAQNLPGRSIEELRMLSNFQVDGHMLLQSFLLGQKEFRATMRSRGFEQLRQRVIAAYHLKPLDGAETRHYIEHRLHTVGWKNDPSFDADAFEAIYEHTRGVPRIINSFCDRLLLFANLEETHHVDSKIVAAVAGDIAEEQGEYDEAMGLEEAAYEPPERVNAPAREHGERIRQDDRLAAVEDSVTSLASSMREEIERLRKALLDHGGHSK